MQNTIHPPCERRKSLGIPKRTLAGLSGVSTYHISKYESDKRSHLSLAKIQQIEDALAKLEEIKFNR